MPSPNTGRSRLIRPRRKINAGAAGVQPTPAQKVAESQLRYILNHPKKELIISALKEGLKFQDIAGWFAREGWLDSINENTFMVYIGTFKRTYPEYCKSDNKNSIDGVIDANQPDMDVEVELNRLIRLQKVRLRAVVDFEQQDMMKSLGALQPNAHKEIAETRLLLETLAKVQGKGITSTAASGHALPADAASNIHKLRVDESARDRMSTLTEQFLGALNNGNSNSAKAKAPDKTRT